MCSKVLSICRRRRRPLFSAADGRRDLLSGQPAALESPARPRIRARDRVRHEGPNDKNSSASENQKRMKLTHNTHCDELYPAKELYLTQAPSRAPSHHARHTLRYPASTSAVNPFASINGDLRIRSRIVARNCPRRPASPAKSAAIRIYSSGVLAIKSAIPILLKMLTPLRDTARSPASVITGTPIQSASQVVVPPAYGNVSSAISIN